MAKYFYIAKSLKGEEKSGTMEVKNERELARVLHQEGYILVRAELESSSPGKRKFAISLPFLSGVSLTEKLMFTRNLGVMIAAGIPLPRILRTLAGLSRSKKLKTALLNVEDKVIKGDGFSDSLAEHPDIFPELFTSIMKVGEETGTLEDGLKILTQQMEREHELKSKLLGALTYPAVIILAMLGIGFLMLVTVVPKLAETFAELNVELPPTTQLVINIGNFLANFWYLVPLIILIFLLLLRMILKTKAGRKAIDALGLKMPIISSLVIKTNSASTVRTLSSLISAGVPIVRALEILSGSLGNVYYKQAIRETVEEVRKGGKISDVLRKYENIYPALVTQMLGVGEETGQTSNVLQKLADFYEEEVTNATKALASLIEPVIMLVIGAAVGFFAISMIQPMYSMLGAIK
ncbi:type II secretion system F family protein [Patescibacteria group bacterium]|nr:type II secretion system F family protein [Patescibacteria group bacterium]MBU4481233.1 type II secretion system F family protein [Patescibacteria group bacterium]